MRWRIQKEVIDGKGQFICGNKRCQENEGLKSWEVNFAYQEQGERKNALVKLRLCPDCSFKLNYHHQRKLAKQAKKEQTRKEKHSKKKKKRKKRGHKDEKYESSTSSSEDEKNDDEDDSKVDADEKGSHLPGTSNEGQPSDEIWKGPAKPLVDKTREEEFEEYFEDMFL